MRVTYGLCLLKGRFSRWDWPKGKMAWSTGILAVTGRCFVKTRIILPSVRFSSVVYLFTSTSGGNAISIFQFHFPRDLVLCYITYYLLFLKGVIGKLTFSRSSDYKCWCLAMESMLKPAPQWPVVQEKIQFSVVVNLNKWNL